MNEHNLGYRVRQILNQGLALDAEKLARLKTAREQCVFTLPCEQPMTAAAAATSISSQ